MYREEVIEAMKQVFKDDDRSINHVLDVLNYAEAIMAGEHVEGEMRRIVTDAAVLHDIGIKEAERKYGSSAGPYQEKEGPPIAKEIMERLGRPAEVVERVCYIVGHHHTPSKVDGLDFQIIWEADLLVNMRDGGLDADQEKMKHIIDKNFKTQTGMRIARTLFIREAEK